MACAACDRPRVRAVPVPVELTSCADEPPAPDLPSAIELRDQILRDHMTLDYILALRSAWGDCRAKVDGTREWNRKIAP